VRRGGLERHHASQQLIIEGRIATEADIAKTVTLAALIDQFDVGVALRRVDLQLLTVEAAGEIAIARGLAFDAAFDAFIVAMVQLLARPQLGKSRQGKGALLRSRPLNAHGDVAQGYRLSPFNAYRQPGGCAVTHFGGDPRLVIAEGLGSLTGLS